MATPPRHPTLDVAWAAPSSGSVPFDELRNALSGDAGLRSEVEAALRLNVDRVNPSDPGNRFVVGGAVEWIIAAAAWSIGALTVPGGHGQRGFDLLELQEASRGLWSVKSQSASRGSEWRISNGLGGSGKGFDTPTVFVSPNLPGLVFVHPDLHDEVTSRGKQNADAFIIPWSAVKAHASEHPECVAVLNAPANEGRGRENPFLSYAKTIITPERFPRLSGMFIAAEPPQASVSEEVQRLAALKDAGTIDAETFQALVASLSRR